MMVPLEFVILIVIVGLLFDYTNGFHDAANVVSTVIATRVLRPVVAIVLAALLNMLGATQISQVAHTMATGLVDPTSVTHITVLAALVGAIFWNLLTWYFGIPSSSSYALVGGLLGASLMDGGFHTVIWSGVVYKVVIPMVCSPVIGFVLGFALLSGLNWCIKKGLFVHQDKIFGHLQIVSASAIALAHGLNDAQKSMGIITLGLFTGGLISQPLVPLWVILACAVMIGLGTASGGMRIIRTVGYEITSLRPLQGFAAETSSSVVILAASCLGMPISSTHMIVGSVTGVGVARSPTAVHWSMGKKMGLAWLFTLPGAALVSAAVCNVLYKML